MNKKLIRLTESGLHRIVKESVKRILNEGAKAVDPNNVVPQELAKKYMFAREYVDETNGLEIWGKNITGYHFFNQKRGPHDYSPQELLYALNIKRFTDILKLPGGNTRVRITVEGDPKSGMRITWGKNRPRKIGDYVDTEWGDKDGAIFHNPNNGHTKRIKQGF